MGVSRSTWDGLKSRGMTAIGFQRKPVLKRWRDSRGGWGGASENTRNTHVLWKLSTALQTKSSATEIAFDCHHLHLSCSQAPGKLSLLPICIS